MQQIICFRAEICFFSYFLEWLIEGDAGGLTGAEEIFTEGARLIKKDTGDTAGGQGSGEEGESCAR